MTSPEFVTEMTAQLRAARQDLQAATDAEGAALATARLADLTELARRGGVDIEYIDGLAAGPVPAVDGELVGTGTGSPEA